MSDLTQCKACNNATGTYTSSHSGHPCCMGCKFSRVTNLRDTNLQSARLAWLKLRYKELCDEEYEIQCDSSGSVPQGLQMALGVLLHQIQELEKQK